MGRTTKKCAQFVDEPGADFVPHQGPHLTDVMNFSQCLERSIGQRVCSLASRVRVRANSSLAVHNVCTKDEVRNGICRALLLRPLRKSIRPTLAHSAGLSSLKAATGPSTSEAVGNTVSVLVSDNVILECAIAVGGGVGPSEHAHLTGLAVGRSRKVGVVGARRILDGDLDAVVLGATLAVVVLLEVVRDFVESVTVLKYSK